MNFKKYYKLGGNAEGNDWVIPDIHGCIQSFEKLVARLNLSQHDRLFLLGDYVNKGPNSARVIDLILELKQKFKVWTLRGNHEQMILDFAGMSKYEFEYHLLGLNSTELATNEMTLKTEYRKFFQTLPYFIELPAFYLVHGGFDFQIENTFSEYERMIWLRNMVPDLEKLQGKQVVHGHIPNPIDHIKRAVNENNIAIPLDNGCVYPYHSDLGNLLALNLNSMELLVQPNIEEEV